jgi:hypothetical protein
VARAAKLLVVAVSRSNRVYETLIPCAFSVVAGKRTHGKITVLHGPRREKYVCDHNIRTQETNQRTKDDLSPTTNEKGRQLKRQKTAGQVVDGSPLWMS